MAKPWRTTPLPKDWAQRRRAVLERDGHQCQINGPRCLGRATEVDHKGDSTDHRLPMLQAVCSPCHASKTGRDARARQPNRARPPERHPGLVTPRD